MKAQGMCAPQFEAVKQAFEDMFDDPQERGAGLCVQVGGETVVDLWAGMADQQGMKPWTRDTLANTFCVIKPYVAVAVLMLVEQGKLELDAPVRLTAACLPWMNRGGRIINIASILGRAGKVRNTGYCASKHGLLGYSKALALELAPQGITVNAVLPGWVETPMLLRELNVQAEAIGSTSQQVLRNARRQLPIKRLVAEDEVAAMVDYLASPQAAAVTAQSLVIDGGFTCGM